MEEEEELKTLILSDAVQYKKEGRAYTVSRSGLLVGSLHRLLMIIWYAASLPRKAYLTLTHYLLTTPFRCKVA